MTPKRRWRPSMITAPLVLGGLGLLALVVAAALLWSEGRSVAWAALVLAVLLGMRIGREVVVRRQGETPPDRWLGPAPLALLSGLGFLLLALLR